MKLDPKTIAARDKIKQAEHFTENELEEYFIFAVLELKKYYGGRYQTPDELRKKKLYDELRLIYGNGTH
jgi:hypothetical protein